MSPMSVWMRSRLKVEHLQSRSIVRDGSEPREEGLRFRLKAEHLQAEPRRLKVG